MKSKVISVAMTIMIGTADTYANLLINGDFELGNTGFLSSYRYNPQGSQPGAEGDYYVGDNSKAWNGNFPQPMRDHTTGSGLMLLCNGSNNRSITWQQTVDVVAGVEYEFSSWVASLYTSALPRLEFLIDGQAIGNILTTPMVWKQFSTTWIASHTGSVTLSIRDLNTDWLGNDFAIDDLYFEAIWTLPDPIIQIDTPLNASYCVEATGAEGAVVTVSVGNLIDDPSIVYYWSNLEGATTNGAAFDFVLGLNQSTVVFLTVEDTITGDKAASFKQVRVSDTTPPEIMVLFPKSGEVFNGNNLQLKVNISDAVDPTIKDYTVSIGRTATYPLNPGTGTSCVKLFKPITGIAPTPTDITVTARDASGNSSSKTVQVMQLHDRRKK